MIDKNKGGRPPYEPTERDRKKVRLRSAAGYTQLAIADELEITIPTLTKHFQDELIYGWQRTRAHVLDLMMESAEKGNVSAQKELLAITAAAVPLEGDAQKAVEAEKPKAATAYAYVSKKAQAKEAAKTAGLGTEWGEDLMASPQNRPN